MLGTGARTRRQSTEGGNEDTPQRRQSAGTWEEFEDSEEGIRVKKRKRQEQQRQSEGQEERTPPSKRKEVFSSESNEVHQATQGSSEKRSGQRGRRKSSPLPTTSVDEIHEAIADDLDEEDRLKLLVDHVCWSESTYAGSGLEELPVRLERMLARGQIKLQTRSGKPTSMASSGQTMSEGRKDELRRLIKAYEEELAAWREVPAHSSPRAGGTVAHEKPKVEPDMLRINRNNDGLSNTAVAVDDGCTISQSAQAAKERRELRAEALESTAQRAEAIHSEADRVSCALSNALRTTDFSGLNPDASPGSLAMGLRGEGRGSGADQR